MKLQLKSFQEIAVDSLMEDAADARAAALKGRGQALILSAPTGSGKTMVATAWLERLLAGDEHYGPNGDATFLWLTDQPELNTQTLRKVSDGSDVFDKTMLVPIEADSFDQELFDPALVYFLNTQKLSRTSKLTDEEGDFRQHSIWETIRNTAMERPDSFWVVIDEAHRGMREDGASRDEARTIVQKFIKGSDQLPPVPLILGLSATTQRFTDLLSGTNRTQRPTVVDPVDVRASGLLKDSITLHHSEDDKHSDFTLLADAALRVEEYRKHWNSYSLREAQPSVHPILVVQVEDGTKSGKKQLSRTDLEEAIGIIEKVLGPLARDEVAHCFQEGSSILIGEDARPLDYVAPSDIEKEQSLRVIFFKRSLSTGWDCPRAEVMMSFRSAKDETLIAQLVGRMVRTPLARRVGGGELLNSVSLYLPYYDEDNVDSVISRLSQEDADAGIPATSIVRGDQVETLARASAMDAPFEAALGLPIYRVQRVPKLGPVKRLVRLGLRLGWDGIDSDANDRFTTAIVAALEEERTRVSDTKTFRARLADAAEVGVRAVTVSAGETVPVREEHRKLLAVSRNIDNAYADASRRLGDTGVALEYLRSRIEKESDADLSALKLELHALVEDVTCLEAVEGKAEALAEETLDTYETRINLLPEDKRQSYRAIRRQGSTSRAEAWELPFDIQAAAGGDTWERHIYVNSDGEFTAGLNALEKRVLLDELEDPHVIGWLRNQPNKPWAFSLSYERHGEEHEMYPDFIVFRKQSGAVVVDLLEPHSQRESDSVAKAQGLADFASRHGDRFGRIELIDEIGHGSKKLLKRLPLKQGKWQKLVKDTHTEGHLKQHFENAP